MSGPPKPPGWRPASSADEALDRMRRRWDHEPLDLGMVTKHVMERIAIMYEHRPQAPEYRILQSATACRIFRRTNDGWRSAYVHNSEDVDRVITWMEKSA